MTETELRVQYAERTWDFEFPECIEQALENDYVLNSVLYTDDMIKKIKLTLLVYSEISPEKLIEMVHREDHQNT